ncbi:eukaryotic translation initiation factor [Cryptosporidium ryanae]|uniref:eukaryotic translation initiation factor n=1 Tax=Cryptosporidium ryanae TaxID=515981 RepID=UPI00351AA84D|nr:eukaryotic translation initiation factor [Cryptosporidium ryanae]
MDSPYNNTRSAWADEDLDDFEPSFDEPLKGFESKPDKDGIKYVISYIKDNKGSTVKITKKVKEIRNVVKINKNVLNRRVSMERNLGDRFHSDTDIPKLGDEISIDIPKNTDSMSFKNREEDDDDDYYFMDLPSSINNNNKLSIFKRIGNNYSFFGDEQQVEKISYGQSDITSVQNNASNNNIISGINTDTSQKITGVGSTGTGINSNIGFNSLSKNTIDRKDSLVSGSSINNTVGTGGVGGFASTGRYQPPFMRTTSSSGLYERIPSLQSSHRDDCTVRVANLSEDATEEDLQELFKTAGRVVKVFLAKNKNNSKNTKGFAFITYSRREEAQNAIKKLNRHGYDNLLLNVEWAKTKER